MYVPSILKMRASPVNKKKRTHPRTTEKTAKARKTQRRVRSAKSVFSWLNILTPIPEFTADKKKYLTQK